MVKKEMITPKEFAVQIGRPYQTVMYWLRQGLVPGAKVKQESRGPAYMVPADSAQTFAQWEPKTGRPRKPLSELVGKPRRKDRNVESKEEK
jgi:hypothetical protein